MTEISQHDLRVRLAKGAAKYVSDGEAAYFAEEIVEAHIRKQPKSSVLESAVHDLVAAKNSSTQPSFDVDLPAFAALDFHGQAPQLYLKMVHDEVEQRAKKNGLAMMAFRNSRAMDTLHVFVQGLAKRGLVAIAVCNGGPGAVVPYGGTQGLLGTNPIAYGFPGKNGTIHCVDMATSEVTFYGLVRMAQQGKELPAGVAVDKNGNATTDVKEALDTTYSSSDPITNILPIGGGYKGYYLSFLLELLTSGLIGMPSSAQMKPGTYVLEEHGSFILAFSPAAMGTEEQLDQSVEALEMAIRAQKPKEESQMIFPGDGNNSRFAELSDSDLEIDVELIHALHELLTV